MGSNGSQKHFLVEAYQATVRIDFCLVTTEFFARTFNASCGIIV